MKITDLMTKNFKAVKLGETIENVRKLLVSNKAVLVVDNDRLVGIITQADIVGKYEPGVKTEDVMTRNIITIQHDASIQEAAKLLNDHRISILPVLDDSKSVIGILTTQDIIKDIAKEEDGEKLSPEEMAIHLAMTKSRDLEDYWLHKAQENEYKAVITQVGSNAEKLAIKMRESAIVAAIAKGVVRENLREKIAISNAVRDVYLQLNAVNPGLGGGFKLAVVVGEGRVTVAAFGRCGHALANGPEQIVLGFSII